MTIALWCGLIAMLLPYVCFDIARNRGEAQTIDACATTTIPAIFRIGSGAWRSARGTRNSIRSNRSRASRRPSIAHPVHAPQHPVDALAHGLGRGADGLCGVLPGRQGCAAVGGAVLQPGLRTWVFVAAGLA